MPAVGSAGWQAFAAVCGCPGCAKASLEAARPPDGGVLFLQGTRHTGDGAGGAHGADEMGDAHRRFFPDPRGQWFPIVNARIVGIGKLVEHPALALALHVLRQVARVFHAAALGREHQLGAKGLHGLGPLDRQGLPA